MAKTFSFEEATKPVASEPAAPKTFSFEDAVATPKAAIAVSKTFSFEEAIAPVASETTIKAPVVEAKATARPVNEKSVSQYLKAADGQEAPTSIGNPALSNIGFDTGVSSKEDVVNQLVGPLKTTDPRVTKSLYDLANKNYDFASAEAQRALRSGATKEQAADIFANKLQAVASASSNGTMRYPDSTMQSVKNAITRGGLGFGRDVANIAALGAGAVGADTTSRELLGKSQQLSNIAEQYPGQFASSEEALAKGDTLEDKAKNMAIRALEGSIENAPSMLASIGGASGARLLATKGVEAYAAKYGRKASEELLDKAAKYGVASGALATSTGLEAGSIYQDIYTKTGELRPAVATAFGTLAGALDAIIPMKAATAINTVARKEMIDALGKTIAQRYGVEALKSMGIEGTTEFLQTFIGKGGVSFVNGDPIFNRANTMEALDAAFIGTVMGGGTTLTSQAVQDLLMKTRGLSRADAKKYYESEQAANNAQKEALDKWKTKGLTQKINLPTISPEAAAADQGRLFTQPGGTPTAAAEPTKEELVKKYIAQGQTKQNAKLLADQDIADRKEVEDAGRTISGTTGESVQISGQPEGQPIAGGTTESVGTTVDGVGSIAGTTEDGTVQQPTPLVSIPYDTVVYDPTVEGNKRQESGEANIIDYGGRKIVLRTINGVQVPFYLSTGSGGKKDVPAGKWYPFFGIGPDGWINKTGGKEMAGYYNSAALRQEAELLDSTLGDIRDQEHTKVGSTGAHVDAINAGLTPTENNTSETLNTVRKNITDIVSRIEQQNAPVAGVPEGFTLTTPPVEEVQPEEAVQETPEVTPEEPLPAHVIEGKELARKLSTIDPKHPMIPFLRDEISVTPEDVAAAKIEIAELRKEPDTTVEPPPAYASPDIQVRNGQANLNDVFDPSAYEDIKELKKKLQEHKNTRIQTIAGLQDLVNDPQYADTYVASAAQDLLAHPSVKKEELEAASKLQYPARQEKQDYISKQAIAADDALAEEAYMSAQSTAPNQSIKVKPSANVGRLADLLGPQLYGDLSSMAGISVKELFQNSFDAIKALIEREGKTDGRIEITTDPSARTITIKDNGNGMNPEIIQKAFLTLAGTNKDTERSSGGFGIAKMQFLFGSERLHLSTVRNGVKSVLDTSGKQLKAALDDESQSPSINTEATDEPSGTTITVTVPKSFKDPSSGEDKSIDFVPSYSAPDSLTSSPLFEPITVIYNGDVLDIGKSFPFNDYVPFANIKFEWGNARIVVSKQETFSKWGDNVTVLSNGLLQFGLRLKKNPKDYNSENIPRRFYVNVEPLVKPEEPGYPFELSRQGFSKNVKGDFDKIFNYLNVLYRGNEAALIAQGFGDIEYITADGKSSGPQKLAPPISNAAESLMLINEGDNIEVVDGRLIVNGREIPELTADTLENTRIDIAKFKIDQDDINPNTPMLHTNLGVQQPNELERLMLEKGNIEGRIYEIQEDSALGKPVNIEEYRALEQKRDAVQTRIDELVASTDEIPDGPITPITELARDRFGNKFDLFVHDLGKIFIDIRNEIAQNNPSRYEAGKIPLSKLGIGVSFDQEYHGVHVRVPFQAMFVNPASLNYDDIQRQADSLYYTMVHEASHYQVGGHNATFWAEDNQLAIELRALGVETIATHKLRALLTKNKILLEYLRSVYNDPGAKNIGKQLEDAQQSTDVGLDSDTNENIKDEAKARGRATNKTGAGTTGGQGGNSQPNQQGAGTVGQGQNNTGVPTGPKKSGSVKVDKILLKIARSESAEDMGGAIGELIEAETWEDKKRVLNASWEALTSKGIFTLLPALTTSQITDWVGSRIPHLNQVTRFTEKMSVMRSKMLAAITDVVDPWADYAKASITRAKALSRMMHYSTLSEVDPSIYNNIAEALLKDPQLVALRKKMDAATMPREKAAYKGQITTRQSRLTQAYKMWSETPAEGRSIFERVRDHYRTTFNLHRAILDERVQKSSVPGDINDASTPKGRLMAAIRQTYEDAKQIGVYFPLMRYGNYWMSLGSGVNKEFYMFESETQRNLFLNKRVAQLQKAGDPRTNTEILESGEFDAGNDLTKLRNLTAESSEMLQGIFKIIDTQNLSNKEELKDAVYQMYLMTMPEQSFRKQFIHRKGTAGFSGDALRNFVRAGYSTAGQLSRLKFGPDITLEMDAAHAALEGMPPKEKVKLGLFLNEVGKRVGEELSPEIEDQAIIRLANGVNQAAFLWRLTSPKSAFANMTAIPIFGLPVLASRYGEIKAAAMLARYGNVFNHTTFVDPDGKYTPLSVGLSKRVQSNPVLAAAFDEASERGITEITRTYDLVGMARTPSMTHQNMVSRGVRAGINLAGILFHHSERLNREIMFMASFELAYDKATKEGLSGGMNGEAFNRAIDEAVKNTYDSMFNYSKYNRPRIMRSPAGRIVFQFKLFPQQVTAYLVRNFMTMLKGSDLNPRARREAATQFFGTLIMTGVFAGIVGMPLYSVIIGVIQGLRKAMRDDDDEPIPIEERDLDLWFRKWLAENFGAAATSIEKGPVSALTNMDIASSTSLNNLWFRDTKFDPSMANQFNDFIINAAGPGAGLVQDSLKAYDDFRTGHFNEGVIKLLPAFAKGAYTQYVWGQEGIKVKGSQAIIFDKDEVTKTERFWKAFGFNPTRLTQIQEANYPVMELVQRAEEEKKGIMNRLNLELAREDDAGFERALQDAVRFTEANPEMAILGTSIANSAVERAKLRAMADRGLLVPPKLMPKLYELVSYSRPKESKEEMQRKFDARMKAAEVAEDVPDEKE